MKRVYDYLCMLNARNQRIQRSIQYKYARIDVVIGYRIAWCTAYANNIWLCTVQISSRRAKITPNAKFDAKKLETCFLRALQRSDRRRLRGQT